MSVLKIKNFIVLLGVLALAGCQTLETIDKGLYQAAESVSERDAVTGKRSLSFAERGKQIAQGNRYIEAMIANEAKNKRPVNDAISKAMYNRLQRVFIRIHTVSHFRDEVWKPVLIKRDSFNAFTTGGTYIVVHTRLMEELPSDDELAAVIGHEIAHTVANHVFERQSHSQLAALSGSASARTSGYQAAFTHENEREADQIGILYAALAGFDPNAASRIWLRQFKKEGNARALFVHDHPVNQERYQETLAIAKKVQPYYKKGRQHPNFVALLDNNVLWRKDTSSVAAGQGGGVHAVLTTALGAFVQHKESKAEAQRQLAQAQFVKAVEGQMKVVKQSLTAKGLRLELQYQQGPTLKSLVMGLMVKVNDQYARSVAHVSHDVKAGQRFVVVLPYPEGVSSAHMKQTGARLYVDDAAAR